jgi:polysaccharide biosynthesis/export protein
MSILIHPGYSRAELRPWHVAAAVLFIALLGFSSSGHAQSRKAATVTPVGTPSSTRVPATQVAAATPTAAQTLDVKDVKEMRAALESIGVGDMVRVTVFRNPDLTTETRVTDQGTIAFPLLGDVPVAGMTPSQVGRKIADKLSTGKYVVNPEVAVTLMQVNSRQVSVLGNVNKPGRYPIDNVNTRLTDFLAAAGGVAAPGSDLVTVVSMRDGKATKKDVDLSQMFVSGNVDANLDLQPGDTIYVHRAPMVYVYGEVNKAGAYRLEPHMTVMQAIAMGGGLTVRGTQRGLKIHRRGDDGRVQKLDAHLTDEVRTDDVVYVDESLF